MVTFKRNGIATKVEQNSMLVRYYLLLPNDQFQLESKFSLQNLKFCHQIILLPVESRYAKKDLSK